MRAAVLRLRRLYYTPQGKKLVRYGMVSIVSALIGFTILTLVYGVLQLWTEVPSVLFSNILATFPNYVLNRKWVWGKSGRSHLGREIIPFWIMSITAMVLALLTASFARNFSDAHDLSHWARTVVIVGANTTAFGVIWFLKFIIINRLFQTSPDPKSELETEVTPVGQAGAPPMSIPKAGVVNSGSAEPDSEYVEGSPE